jgi:chromosome partitioning protein
MIPARTPRGVLIAAARLGTNDLEETIAWWKAENVPVWGVIPERVGIAAGPEARLYREGLQEYETVLKRALRKR